MRRFRVYLDTSVLSHLFHDDMLQRRMETEEFFRNAVATGAHEVFISQTVLEELERVKDAALRDRLLGAAGQVCILLLPAGESEIDELAKAYIERGIVPAKKPEDALHIAFATFYEMDYLATWNFRHLARARTALMVSGVNLEKGFAKPLHICTPLELLNP